MKDESFGTLLELIASTQNHICADSIPSKSLTFSESHPSEWYQTFTGLSKENFDKLLTELPFREGEVFSKRDSLGVYLLRMRTGTCSYPAHFDDSIDVPFQGGHIER